MWLAVAILGGYALLVGGMYAGQRALIYHPSGETPRPAASGLDAMSVVRPETADGLRLYAWWAPPPDPEAPVVLYFHGNAGNLDDRAGRARFFLERGYGLLLTTYRYNADTGGEPSEAALLADARRFADWLGDQGVESERIALYGESIGSAMASALAGEGRGAALIVEAGFDSLASVAQATYPYLPAKWLVKDRYDNARRLADSPVPKLIVHGARDGIVKPRHARALHAAAAPPKRLEILEEAAHNDLFDHGMGPLVADFLAEVFPRGDGRD